MVVHAASCSATSAATTVTILTAYTASITGATGVCTGSTATVTDSTTGGVWSTSNASVVSVSSTGTLYGVSAGSATITYTSTNACGTSYRTASITASAPVSVAAITGTTSACPGSAAILADATTGGTWSSSDPTIATVNTTGLVTAVSSGTATISYSVPNAFGCIAYATTTFTSLATPTAVITPAGATSVCLGASVVLNATTGTGYSYQWQVGGTNISGATTTSYTASTTGNYGLVVTSTSGCTASATVVPVTVSSSFIVVPAVSVAVSPGSFICTGTGAVSFTPTAVNGGSAPAFQWYVNGTPVSAATSYSYTPANGDVVTCKLTSNAACAFPDTAIARTTMTVSPYDTPSVAINAVPNDTVCEGSTGAFTAMPTHGGTAPTYMWNLNGSDVYSGPTYYYTPRNGDVLVVKMHSNYLCRLVSDVQSAPHVVTVVPVVTNFVNITASATSIITGTAVTFTATAPAGAGITYQWLINGIAIPGATSSTFTTNTLSNGQVVRCRVASGERCVTPTTVTSAGITMLVSTGIQQVGTGADVVTIEPNPNTGNFYVSGSFAVAGNTEVSIKLTNLLGQVVYQSVAQATNGALHEPVMLGNNLASGVYIATVTVKETGKAYLFQVVVGK
ncbi:MAG: T9SS C-terminal target domain-containing protein [Chitinophagia bacterium]|nr:T9SS C-terminal target domain-containing protein [Chitinophagia bacterium]